MPIDKRAGHELYLAIEELVGAERADTLMDLLPPVGWPDVATKADLSALEERLGLRFEAKLERALRDQTHSLVFALVGSLAAMATLCIAAIAFAR
jgi:hypothetical protein